MPAARVSMRRVREILRLKHECGATDRAIARSLGIARSTVAVTLDHLAAAELGWPLLEASRSVVLGSVADLPSGSPIRQIAKPVGEIEIGAPPGPQTSCTGWLTRRNFVITAAYCVSEDVKNIRFRLGHLSETITRDIYNLVRLVE